MLFLNTNNGVTGADTYRDTEAKIVRNRDVLYTFTVQKQGQIQYQIQRCPGALGSNSSLRQAFIGFLNYDG